VQIAKNRWLLGWWDWAAVESGRHRIAKVVRTERHFDDGVSAGLPYLSNRVVPGIGGDGNNTGWLCPVLEAVDNAETDAERLVDADYDEVRFFKSAQSLRTMGEPLHVELTVEITKTRLNKSAQDQRIFDYQHTHLIVHPWIWFPHPLRVLFKLPHRSRIL
jgi:hypothetical protein